LADQASQLIPATAANIWQNFPIPMQYLLIAEYRQYAPTILTGSRREDYTGKSA
jgi:hypothetical protein